MPALWPGHTPRKDAWRRKHTKHPRILTHLNEERYTAPARAVPTPRNSRVSPSPSASKASAPRTTTGLLLAAAVMALCTYYSLQQMKHWITPSWDLAIFTQMAQAYSHFSRAIVPIKGADFNLWGDHSTRFWCSWDPSTRCSLTDHATGRAERPGRLRLLRHCALHSSVPSLAKS